MTAREVALEQETNFIGGAKVGSECTHVAHPAHHHRRGARADAADPDLGFGRSAPLRFGEFPPVCPQFRQTNQRQCKLAPRSIRLVSARREGAGVDAPLFNA